MILEKDGLVRDIKDARAQEYIAAGWHRVNPAVVQAEEVINLKPPARVKAAAKKADDDGITQGDE